MKEDFKDIIQATTIILCFGLAMWAIAKPHASGSETCYEGIMAEFPKMNKNDIAVFCTAPEPKP